MALLLQDKAGYVAAIVERWEASAREIGRWDANYTTDLSVALMKLDPDNLLAAGEAASFKEMMTVLATGRPGPAAQPDVAPGAPIPLDLGSFLSDLVYTPLTPCRIADTRVSGGAIGALATRFFDADGSTFTAQGGVATTCGVPYGVSTAVAMTIAVTQPTNYGWLTAWGLGPMPNSSVLNYGYWQDVANTTILPIAPGAGADFAIWSYVGTHVVIDVVGYYTAPVATALDCTNVQSAIVDVPVNVWTPIDAICPTGRSATGGGFFFNEGTFGVPGIWAMSVPLANGWRTWVDNQTSGTRQVLTWCRCCRIPGR